MDYFKRQGIHQAIRQSVASTHLFTLRYNPPMLFDGVLNLLDTMILV